MKPFSINTSPKALNSDQEIAAAQDLFAEYQYDFFPVTNNGVYIGCINLEDAEIAASSKLVLDFTSTFERFFARANMSLLEVLNLFSVNNTNILPVLNENNEYIGFYEKDLFVKNFFNTPFINEQGDLIIVKKEINNFTMSEVTQIIEGNNSKIFGVLISEIENNTVEITLKISIGNLNDIIQTFRRYDYEIISEHQEDAFINDLKERSDYLDKYLSI
jgi:predicted transcriptional regulator